MRELIRGNSIKEVEAKANRYFDQNKGWKAVSDVKLDPSLISYNVVEYVQVLETKEVINTDIRKWGKF